MNNQEKMRPEAPAETLRWAAASPASSPTLSKEQTILSTIRNSRLKLLLCSAFFLMVDKGQLVADISLNGYILRENSYAAALIENLSESFYSFDIVYDYGRWLRPKHSTWGFKM